MVDFHTHILPGIDDGSPDAKTSVLMLQSLYEQGIDRAVMTPHFYMTRDNTENFFKRREQAVSALISEAKNKDNIPRIVLGAEVLLYPELGGMEGLERFCIEGTNYLLVEMPFGKWSNVTYDTLGKIRANGILPIIAHVERYIKIQKDKNMIPRLLDMGCMIQANSSFFTSFLTKRKAIRLLVNDAIHFVGSDCHDLTKRKPDTGSAYEVINKKLGVYGIENLEYIADLVLDNAVYRI